MFSHYDLLWYKIVLRLLATKHALLYVGLHKSFAACCDLSVYQAARTQNVKVRFPVCL